MQINEQDFIDIGDGVQLMKGRLKEDGEYVVASRYLAMIYPGRYGCRMATTEDLWKGYVKSEEVRKSIDGGSEWTADVLVNGETLVRPEAAKVSISAEGKFLEYRKIPALISLGFSVPNDVGYAIDVKVGFPTGVVRIDQRKKMDGHFYLWWDSLGDGVKTIILGKPHDSDWMNDSFVVRTISKPELYELPFRLARDSRLNSPNIRKAEEPKGE